MDIEKGWQQSVYLTFNFMQNMWQALPIKTICANSIPEAPLVYRYVIVPILYMPNVLFTNCPNLYPPFPDLKMVHPPTYLAGLQ